MSTETTESLDQVLREEAALRRVAMLVAGEAPQSAVFEAVAAEASGLLAPAEVQVARVDDQADLDETIARIAREAGPDCAIAVPIVVSGTTWGALVAVSPTPGPLAKGSIARLADFSRLVASAIASVQAREELRGLAEQQGALRRVATLVARGAGPERLFDAIAGEASRILGVGAVSLVGYDADTRMVTLIAATHGQRAAVPRRGQWSINGSPLGELIVETGRPVRIDDWTRLPGSIAARHREERLGPAVAAPIIVDGAIWGYLAASGEAGEILPPGCETRLADFTHLMATAISNVQARDELRSLAEQQGAALRRVAISNVQAREDLRRLADEQGALRRVATLVAQGAEPKTLFAAVAGEAAQVLGVAAISLCSYDPEPEMFTKIYGTHGERSAVPDGNQFALADCPEGALVVRTGQPARIDDWTHIPGPVAVRHRELGFGQAVAAPIIVDGAIWGFIAAYAETSEILPPGCETRLADFTQLVASSISNVDAHNRLIASRARIVTASDDTRRRIERNLHDGIQQRVLALVLSLRAIRVGFSLPREVEVGLDELARDLEGVLEEIRVFSQGLHPALLSRLGLGPSLRALARRSPILVNLDVAGGPRLPGPIETAVYYVVSEALANAAKHSQASEVSVTVVSDTAGVRASVADDGVGGAELGHGSGLIGLVDRVEALGGRFTLESQAGRGTTISIDLPLGSRMLDERPTP